MLAMQRAVEGLGMLPDEAWIDGNRCPRLACRTRAIVRGDRLHAVISAASILAKTARDAEMLRMHGRFPQYCFDRHKGYPTPEHLALLERHGPCEIHRRSFAPVRRLLHPA
jgi:ribonuclease HII